jgi:hypothetical protein
MQRKRTMLWTAALTTVCALLIGYFALQSGADEAVSTHPNDKANHHPKHGDDPTN